jgi:hypothetical protein
VVDDAGILLTTATTTIPADVSTGWIAFAFPEDVTVTAGAYLFAADTNIERQCSLAFCPDEDLYPDGVRMSSLGGLEAAAWTSVRGLFDEISRPQRFRAPAGLPGPCSWGRRRAPRAPAGPTG